MSSAIQIKFKRIEFQAAEWHMLTSFANDANMLTKA